MCIARLYLLCNIANYDSAPAQDGSTALHCAAATNQVDILKLLLSPPHSHDVNIRTHYNETPLHVACLNGHLSAAQLLQKKGADLHARDGKENTVLHLSAASGSHELIHWVVTVNKCDDLLNSLNKVYTCRSSAPDTCKLL